MKNQPSETPPQGPRAKQLSEVLRRSVDDPAAAPVSVEVHIAGGMPSKRYRFDFQARGPRDVRIDFLDNLRKSGKKVDRTDLSDEEWRGLIDRIARSGVLDNAQESPRFLPDTVVGWLEVKAGDTSRRIYFIADEKQAKHQKKVPSKALLDVVETVYAISSRSLDMAIKPN